MTIGSGGDCRPRHACWTAVDMTEDNDNLWDEDDRQRRVRLLEAAGMAQAQDAPLDVAELAGEL